MSSMTQTHQHRVTQTSEPRGFTAPVAVHPYTEANPSAHGGVEIVEVCECGYERRVLENGPHREFSPWRPSEALRAEWQAERDRETVERRRLAAARDLFALAHEVQPRGRIVQLAHGVQLDLAGVERPDDLLEDETEIRVRLLADDRVTRVTVGALIQAARDWADDPDSPEGQVYGAIATALGVQA